MIDFYASDVTASGGWEDTKMAKNDTEEHDWYNEPPAEDYGNLDIY